MFDRLGIRINEVNLPLASAIDRTRKGQISATLLVSGKPVSSLAEVEVHGGLHLLPLPYSAALGQDFRPASLQHEYYPELIPRGTMIETISAKTVLVTYNWPADSERYHLLEALVSTLFPHIRELESPLNHPKWREVNLEATLPTWQRFGPAEKWVEQHPPLSPELQSEFEQFLDKNGSIPMDHERLFKKFLRWHKQHIGN